MDQKTGRNYRRVTLKGLLVTFEVVREVVAVRELQLDLVRRRGKLL